MRVWTQSETGERLDKTEASTSELLRPESFLFQPFCDGAHKSKAPSIAPLRFTPEKDKTAMLCACKETKNPPYCDGSHFKVIFQDVVKSVKGVFKS